MNATATLPKRPTNKIKQARLAAGLTQQQAANRAGIAISTLSLAERTGFLTVETAEKLAFILACEARELLP